MSAKAQTKTSPRLKSLESLDFPVYVEQEEIGEVIETSVIPLAVLDICLLAPFSKHPFKLYTGERLEDLTESIRQNGVLVPVVVRKSGDVFEILSGHNRVNAARLAGLSTVPALVKKNLSDEEAWMYVIETNLHQRSFSEMSHSEKATVLTMQHSKLFSQGKRNDILSELQMLENSLNSNAQSTYSQVAKKLTSLEKVGTEYSLSKDTVARYLRIDKLIPRLKDRLDDGEFAFIPAVTLSFLSEKDQIRLNSCIELNGFKVDMKKADIIRNYSEQGKLDDESIYLILNGEICSETPKRNRTPLVSVSKSVYAKYFSPGQSSKEIQDIVEKALAHYFTTLDQKT